MATRNSRRTKAPTYNDVVGDLYDLGALLAGAESIAHDIEESGTGPANDLELDAINLLKLIRQASARIQPLAERIAAYGERETAEVAHG